MKKLKQEIVRNVRLDKALDDLLIAIAEREDRSISQVLCRLVRAGRKSISKKILISIPRQQK